MFFSLAQGNPHDAVIPKLNGFFYTAVHNAGIEEFGEPQGPVIFGHPVEGFVEPAGTGGKADEEGLGAFFPIEPEGQHIIGTLYGLLNLAARQFQFFEDKVYFFPVKGHNKQFYIISLFLLMGYNEL
jgi:hypothetical protein